jgi:Tol biopolymer transport system component
MDVREIAAVNVESRRECRLLTLAEGSTFPSFGWSADGEELLVSSWDDGSGESRLRRYSVTTGELVVVSSPHTLIGRIAWSPTGRLVAMDATMPGTGRTRLFVLDLQTGISEPVDRRAGAVRSMTWSGPYPITRSC